MVAHNQAKRLVATGHRVMVVTSRTNGEKAVERIDGVHVVRVSAWNTFEKWGIPFPIFSLWLWPTLSKAVKNADVVHIHDAFYISSFLAVLSARLQKKPVVLTQHVALIFHPSMLVAAIQRFVYATSGAIIFQLSHSIVTYNSRVKNFLITRGVPQHKLTTLVNGVDTTVFHPVSNEEKLMLRKKYALSPEKKIILFVGRFVPKKGFDKVLAARSKKYQIVFAGGETTEKSTDDLVFLGKMGPSALAEVYQTADIFLLPSESEGFPLSIQEAMASGLPVITTHDDGYDGYDLDKKLIYFLHAPTETIVRKAVEAIVHDDTKLQKMATYSKGYAHANFSWASIILKLDKIYDELLLP